jgi:hypothetical protein
MLPEHRPTAIRGNPNRGWNVVARPLRIQYPGAWYHLTFRGNERREIFSDDADRHRFLAILAANLSQDTL